MQLKQTSITRVLAVGAYMFNDMKDKALAITEMRVTPGLFTPAARFTTDESVPPNTRYSMPQHVIDFVPGANKDQLEAIQRSRQLLAQKRARIQ